ncbi:hypothetical protein AB0K43_08635 [Kitasatospora sp. NPDC049258]|uniref:COG4315 family predicted lipoprotein n=1 Tax=Kitasatospora sp. NPDC049258 TaxID=3155394 RepID=UPI0034388F25
MRLTHLAATVSMAVLLTAAVVSCANEWRPLPATAPAPTVTATVTATATPPPAPAAAPAVPAAPATPGAPGAPSAPSAPGASPASPAATGTPAPGASPADPAAPAAPSPAATPAPGTAPTPAPGADPGAAVAVASADPLGPVLVDAQGRTLYVFEGDTTTMSTCYEACAAALPPLTTKGVPVAGQGADEGLLGTTVRADGTIQVLYNGRPLYLCAEDTAAGEALGHDLTRFGGLWYAADASGHPVKTPAQAVDSTN